MDHEGLKVVARVEVSEQFLSRFARDARQITKLPIRPQDVLDMLTRRLIELAEQQQEDGA